MIEIHRWCSIIAVKGKKILMRTDIFIHHKQHICAIVTGEEGYKFLDYLERKYKNSQFLVEEAIKGFSDYSYCDNQEKYTNGFMEQYREIMDNEDIYEYLGCIDNGIIDFESQRLANRGEYFRELFVAITLAELNDFRSLENIVYEKDYVVLSSKDEVMAFAKIKIPFEPNEAQKRFKSVLRSHINKMHSVPNQVLCAGYGSASPEILDVENALFNNVGVATFNEILTKESSVYFRRIQPNEISAFDDMDFSYVYHYLLCTKESINFWWDKEIICEWDKIPLVKVNSSTKVYEYYKAIKEYAELLRIYRDGSEVAWGMKIQLFVPRDVKMKHVPTIMKAMLDGIICALHTPKRIDIDKICKLLHADKEMFTDDQKTCLGERCYIHSYRQGIKWDPQDEKLEYVSIEPVLVDDVTFSFSGQIFAIPNHM